MDLEGLAESWLCEEARGDPRRVSRARRLLSFAVPASLAFTVFAATSFLVHQAPALGWPCVAGALAALASPGLLAWTGRPEPAGHLFNVGFALQITGETLWNGGLNAPAAVLIPLLAPAAILLAGRRAGLVWSGVAAAIALGVGFADLAGLLPTPEAGGAVLDGDRIPTIGVGIVFGTFLVMLSERQATDALAALEVERQRFAHLAHHDVLTGLPNRALFHDRLRQAIRHGRRQKERWALLYMDLDGFKEVNDAYDHTVGDRVLKVVAERFASMTREADTLARLGGDEFVLLTGGVRTRRAMRMLALRLEALLDVPIEIEGGHVRLGCSIGVALFPDDAEEAEELLKRADQAMYAVKRNRRS